MSDNRVLVYKKAGQTPLEAISEAKNTYPEWRHLPVTYAGRLDPLAEGALLLLAGDECLKKDEYLALPKEYELSILFGFATDTYDLMGKIVYISKDNSFLGHGYFSAEKFLVFAPSRSQVTKKELSFEKTDFDKVAELFTGRIKQAYPAYSSRTVNGKPLYQWAREGRLAEITIPIHEVFVESIDFLEQSEISGEDLQKKIHDDISRVNGDFRQEEIVALWDNILNDYKDTVFSVVKLRIRCGSGVYVRALANDIGKTIGIPALALKIVRTKIGEYDISLLQE